MTLPPILAAATPPETIPTASGVKRKSWLSTTGARLSSIPIAATSSRSGSWSAKPRNGGGRRRFRGATSVVRLSHERAGGRARSAAVAPTAKLTLADYFDVHLDHAPKEGATLALDTIDLVARSISGGRVNVVGLRLPEDEEPQPLTRMASLKRKLSELWSSVAGI